MKKLKEFLPLLAPLAIFAVYFILSLSCATTKDNYAYYEQISPEMKEKYPMAGFVEVIDTELSADDMYSELRGWLIANYNSNLIKQLGHGSTTTMINYTIVDSKKLKNSPGKKPMAKDILISGLFAR